MKGRMEMDRNAFEQLRAALAAVEPSPGFAAGVRERIKVQSRPALRQLPTFAFAAMAIVFVAAGAYFVQRDSAVVPAAAVPVAQTVTTPMPVEPSVAAVSKVEPVRRQPVSARTGPLLTTVTAAGPFLEVITNQPQIIGRIWAGIDGGVARVGLPANEFAQITVAPVHVDAIVVPKIGPPGGGGIVPGARRVTADDSMRGDQR